jgi:replication factor C subunit 2/4
VTRFILICNYVTRIIEPLASRCAKFRFQALPVHSMKERLQEICTYEHCPSQVMDHMDDVLYYADGDMRRAVTTMQSVHSIVTGATAAAASGSKRSNPSSSASIDAIMSSAVIAQIVGVPPKQVVRELWDSCTNVQASYDSMHKSVENVIASGFSAQLLLSALLTRLLDGKQSATAIQDDKNDSDDTIDELSMAQIAIRIAEAEKNMIDGADEYLQLMTVCSLLFTCYTSKAQTGLSTN